MIAFVGRSDELRGLAARVDSGVPTLVLGERGVGKTRLIGELTSQTDHDVLVGKAWTGARATPYLPWLQVASSATDLLDPISPARPDLDAGLKSLFPGSSGSSMGADETSRHLLAVALGRYLRDLAVTAANRVVIIIEDAHAADPHSIELARRLVDQRVPISLILTSRPFDEAEADTRAELDRLFPATDVMGVVPLGRPAVAELLALEQVDSVMVDEALAATAGNPLALRTWLLDRALSPEGAWAVRIEDRLARLSPEARDLVRTMALLRRDADVATLGRVTRLPAAAVLDGLGEGQAIGLVDQVPGTAGTFRIHHDEYRVNVEHAMTLVERAQGHARLLEVMLELRGTAAEQDVSQLADHAAAASFVGDASLAVELNLEAGDSSLDRAAPLVAHHHYQRAIELAEIAGAARHVRARAELGVIRALKATGRHKVREPILDLLSRSEHDPDLDEVFVGAALELSTSHSGMGVTPVADPLIRSWVERALDRAEADTSRVRLLVELGLQRRGEGREALDPLWQDTVELASQLEDARVKTLAVTAYRWSVRHPNEAEAVLSELDDLELELDPSDVESRFWVDSLRVSNYLRAGRMADARMAVEWLRHNLDPAAPVIDWLLGRQESVLHFLRGDLEAAEATAVAAYEAVKDGHYGEVAFEYLSMQLAPILRMRADPDAVAPLVEQLLISRPDFFAARAGYAWVLADGGRRQEAREQLSIVAESGLEDDGGVEWLSLMTLMTGAATALGDQELARTGVELLEPYRREWVLYGSNIAVEAPVALRRGRAAIVADQLDVAARDLELARATIETAGAAVFEPELFHAEAQLAEAQARGPDATEAMTRASDAAQIIGADKLAGMLAAEAFSLGRRAADAVPSVAPPTRAPTAPIQPAGGRQGRVVRQGAGWVVELGDFEVTIGHLKGMVALMALLERPGKELHSLQLAALLDGTTRGRDLPADDALGSGGSPDLLIDDEALAAYRRRLIDLDEQIDEASRFNDPERQAQAEQERQELLDHVRAASTLNGRSRAAASDNERARVRVTKSLRTAISRLDTASAVIGQHFATSVRTGLYCSYQPDALAEVEWHLDPG
ncbi:MAG: AAA family ATPase [Actinomycetia bacterium]|nr:AAA family ATPase [Actinomycetes bacterium]